MSTEADYVRIKQLISQMPNLYHDTDDVLLWLARAGVLVEKIGGPGEGVNFNLLVDNFGSSLLSREISARRAKAILARMLAKAEQAAPMSATAQFIAVGEPFSTLQAFTKLLESAQKSILVVDPYIDQTFLQRYAGSVGSNVPINLLGAEGLRWGAGLKAALEAWTRQYGDKHPVEYRCLPKDQLHDRIIVIDGGLEVWSVGQSIKDMGEKSPTVLDRYSPEVATQKGDWWQKAFANAVPLT